MNEQPREVRQSVPWRRGRLPQQLQSTRKRCRGARRPAESAVAKRRPRRGRAWEESNAKHGHGRLTSGEA
jgi:hypothetical protein